MIAALLVWDVAPPRPLIWRMSGLPNTSSRMGSIASRSRGRSSRRKKTPLLVPPRRIEQCSPRVSGIISSLHRVVGQVFAPADRDVALSGRVAFGHGLQLGQAD